MLRIIDTCDQIGELFDNQHFNIKKWESYMNSIYKNSAHIFQDDVEEYVKSGKYTFEKDFLPIINHVCDNEQLQVLHQSFLTVTNNLDKRIFDKFGDSVDIDIVLYLGLCNGAGWVTNINGNNTILLGIEKILELNWYHLNDMYGLIYHELGHAYHKQHGIFMQSLDENEVNFVWQLFMEGVATYFEQVLVEDFDYYHQNTNGWKKWCDDHFVQILSDFNRDLSTMTRFNQRYFGDWCEYNGHTDTGYYLGCRLIHYLRKDATFDDIIHFDINKVYYLYQQFVNHFIQ
ncbi:MAG: hypothetical protein ACOX60_11745 [Massiliimalia sp.]|jgi:hypothetical protein